MQVSNIRPNARSLPHTAARGHREKTPESSFGQGKADMQIKRRSPLMLPTGYFEFDSGLKEEINILLTTIGGLYSSFEESVNKIISLCSSANPSITTLSECFPYIKSLLTANSQLTLQENPVTQFMQVRCKSEQSKSLSTVLESVNIVLLNAQSIQQQCKDVNNSLTLYQEKIQFNIESVNKSQSRYGLETCTCINNILMGNQAILTAAQQSFHHYNQLTMQTITGISESLTSSAVTVNLN
jgi:hypothetical protein